MAQQMQQPQGASVQGAGQYGTTAGQQAAGATGLRLQDVETPQQRAAVESIARAIQTCEWCADQCVQLGDPNMTECIRLCEDVSELGEAAITLVPRRSRYAGQVLQAFQQAVQACGQECGRHRHDHCQECAQVLGGTSESIQQLLGTYQ